MSVIKKDMKTTYENTFGVFLMVNMAIASIYLKMIDVKTKVPNRCTVDGCS
jgi:hypothetical protein